MLHFRGNRERERGQIVVLFALVLVVILAFTSLVIDIGLLRNNRQTLVNTLDSAALAGGTLLPVDGSVPGDATKIERTHHLDDQRPTTRACRAPPTRSATSA